MSPTFHSFPIASSNPLAIPLCQPLACFTQTSAIMRTSFLLAFTLLITSTWAARKCNYRHALERVWVWDAYQIDLLNPESDRTLGFICATYDEKKKECPAGDSFKPCKGTGKGGSCTFGELMLQFGKFHMKNDSPPPGSSVEDTAKLLCKQKRDGGFKVYKFIKDAPSDYNRALIHIGEVIKKSREDGETPDKKKHFDRMEFAVDEIKIARVADHDQHVIEAAEKELTDKYGMKVETGSFSDDPYLQTPRRFVDWPKMVYNGESKFDDPLHMISEFRRVYYGSSKIAREHLTVMKTHKTVTAMTRGENPCI